MNTTKDLSLTERAYRAIKRDIIRCDLEPGSQVTEAALAERYGIGRAGVRAALNRLYQERLVQVVPRQSYVIAPITIKTVRDMFGVRLLLEPAAARIAAARMDSDLIHSLDERQASVYRKGDRESAETFLRANTEFHVSIVRGAQNDRLTDIVSSLFDDLERFFYLGLMHRDDNMQMYPEHHKLVEALLSGDGERAEQTLADQISNAESMVLNALLLSPALESVNLEPAQGFARQVPQERRTDRAGVLDGDRVHPLGARRP